VNGFEVDFRHGLWIWSDAIDSWPSLLSMNTARVFPAVALPDSSLKLASRRTDGGLKISRCRSSLIEAWQVGDGAVSGLGDVSVGVSVGVGGAGMRWCILCCIVIQDFFRFGFERVCVCRSFCEQVAMRKPGVEGLLQMGDRSDVVCDI
jgi:hypothetical protein